MVGIGGFLGAIARFGIGDFISARMGARFPYGTFVVNITGCFMLGLIITLLAERNYWDPNWQYLIPIGFIGAYTTFSTFELETLQAAHGGQIATAILNVVLSVVLGLLAVWLGVVAARVAVNASAGQELQRSLKVTVHKVKVQAYEEQIPREEVSRSE
jgi:CrcB protein